MSSSKRAVVSVYRGLLRELSLKKQYNKSAYNFLTQKYRSNQLTSDRYCRGTDSALYNASTYYNLLKSSRIYDELLQEYHGEKDESISRSATRVGLKLPENSVDK